MQDQLEKKNKLNHDFFSYILSFALTACILILYSDLPYIIYAFLADDSIVSNAKLSAFFGQNVYFILQLAPFLFALLTLLFCYKLIHKGKIKQLFTFREKFDFKRFFVSAIVWLLMLGLLLLINCIINPSEIKWNFNATIFFPLLVICLVLIPLQTMFEEILFRSYLLQGFQFAFKSNIMAILISSLLFGLLHFNNPEIQIFGYGILAFYVLSGVFLALITVADNGIELSFGFHFANNLFGALILTNNWQVFQTGAIFKDFSEPTVSWEIVVTLFILYPVLFIIYKKIFKFEIGSIFAKKQL
jgi:hypothetical protein